MLGLERGKQLLAAREECPFTGGDLRVGFTGWNGTSVSQGVANNE
jgi:hypothetical protein